MMIPISYAKILNVEKCFCFLHFSNCTYMETCKKEIHKYLLLIVYSCGFMTRLTITTLLFKFNV